VDPIAWSPSEKPKKNTPANRATPANTETRASSFFRCAFRFRSAARAFFDPGLGFGPDLVAAIGKEVEPSTVLLHSD
jgi:hypothetical protein